MGGERMSWFDRIFKKKKQEQIPPFLVDYGVFNEAKPRATEEYLKNYGQVSIVYACIRLIANNVAAATWRLYKVGKEWQEIEDHVALKLFYNPNPFMTRYDLFVTLMQHLELTGEAMWLLVKNNLKQVIGMVPLNPTKMNLKLGSNNMPEYWEYNTGKNKIRLELDDVVFFKYPDPNDLYRGISPLRAAALTADTDYYATQWNKNFFVNAATPRTAFVVDKPLTDEQYKRLKEMIEKRFKGIENAHKAIILEGGLDVRPLQLSQKDMEFLELRKFSREEIAAVFGVPLTKLGLNDNANKATAYVNDYTFAKNTITPKLVMIKETLNKYFLPLFEENLAFDFDSVIPKDEEFEVNKNVQYVKNNILTINEVRAELGYEPVDWGDEPAVPIMFNAKPPKTKGMSKEDKLKYWDNLVQKRERDESFFKGWVARRFTKQEQRVLENLKNTKAIQKLTQIEAEKSADEIIRFLLSDNELTLWIDYYMQTMPELFGKASQEFAESWGLNLWLAEHNPRTVELLQGKSQRFARRVNETTYRRLKETLIEGFIQGEGERDLAKRVEDVMTLSKRQRAGTIARTEVFMANNNAHLETLLENGVQHKEWLTARDERVREAHAMADGQVVETDQPFIVDGEYLMYPLDPNGSPGNIINCRCVVIPVIG